MRNICFYHNDLSGLSAAAVVNLFVAVDEFIEVDYDRSFPVNRVQEGDNVWIVDFHLEILVHLEDIFNQADKVFWIDHHEATQEPPREITKNKLHYYCGASACGALRAWQVLTEKEPPEALLIIDSWDRRTHNDDPRVLNFVSGIRSLDMSPSSLVWKGLFLGYGQGSEPRDNLEDIITEGSIINRYLERSYPNHLKDFVTYVR